MSFLILVFMGLVAAVSASCNQGPACPDDYVSWESSCYKLYVEALDWQAAEDRCVGDGAHLASVHSSSEDAFLNDLSQSISDPNVGKETWIGFHDHATEGDFGWTDGSSADYANWHSNEPNNAGEEECTEINYFEFDGTWNDHHCNRGHRFICKMQPEFNEP